MVPALAFFVALPRVVEARRDAILSFDLAKTRRAFPNEGATPLEAVAWQAWVRPVVARALARYPAAGLVAHLDHVYVVWLLWYDGTYIGGTGDPAHGGRIVIALRPGTTTETWLERAVHHEFAHTLHDRRGSGFPTKAWRSANAPGFRYGTAGFDAVKAGKANVALDPALAEQGVLSEYGASSIDEDWATIAESVMVDDPAFWDFVARYPRLRTKARLAVAFYRRTLPGIKLRDVGPYRSVSLGARSFGRLEGLETLATQ